MGGTPAPKSFPQPGAIGQSQGFTPLTASQAPQLAPQTPTFSASTISNLNPGVVASGPKGPKLPQNPYAKTAQQNSMWQQQMQGRYGYLGRLGAGEYT